MEGRRLIGYQVLLVPPSGRPRTLGRVRDFAVSPEGGLVLLGEGGAYFWRRPFAVPWDRVVRWEVGRIVVAQGRGVGDVSGWLGRRLPEGVVRDVRFAPEDGRVEALILSRGILRDLVHGRTLVPYRRGGDAVHVSRLRVEGHRPGRR